MVNQCRHIRTSGTQCGMVAMRHQNFCYYHQNCQPRRHRSTVRTRSHTQTQIQTYDYGAIPVSEPATPGAVQLPLQLLFPEDRASIQINLYRIAVAQAENRIDTRTASTMTWNQQVCMANLGKTPLLEAAPTPARPTSSARHDNDSSDFTDPDTGVTYSDSGSSSSRPVSRPVTRVILTPEGDEIAPPVEILEDNEAEPIHHKGCPCLLCAEKYRNQPPEEHHANCQCGLCEEQGSEHIALTDLISEDPDQLAEMNNGCHPERTASEANGESRDLLLPEPATTEGAPSFAERRVGSDNADQFISSLAQQGQVEVPGFSPGIKVGPEVERTVQAAEPLGEATCRSRRNRLARASALLSGSTNRDPLNRPWSVAEYTFGDAIRRHEAQYAARAAACLAVGIEPPPYQPYITGVLRPGTPEWEEEQQMQQHSNEYWAEHFRKQIAERPDIQQYLEEEATAESVADTKSSQ